MVILLKSSLNFITSFTKFFNGFFEYFQYITSKISRETRINISIFTLSSIITFSGYYFFFDSFDVFLNTSKLTHPIEYSPEELFLLVVVSFIFTMYMYTELFLLVVGSFILYMNTDIHILFQILVVGSYIFTMYVFVNFCVNLQTSKSPFITTMNSTRRHKSPRSRSI
jgi:hypothetical protein